MDEVVYLNKDDADLFDQLISNGLTKEQAIEQMKLMGIENKIVVTAMYGYSPIRVNTVIYDECKEKTTPKKKLPWYYGKRRY